MVVQHNLTAMNSQRMLGITMSQQKKSSEKLSSGYKINRAADDAAGLSISEKMRKQIRGLTQASLNAADGISAVQTAEGALHEVQDMLQRMNELAVKAANGTMSANDRGYIQDEVDQLITEIDRVSETTKFNETYLLKGDETAPKSTEFTYKEAEVLSQDLYYIKDGAVNVAKKGTLLAAVDTNLDYYTNSVGPQVGQLAATSDSNNLVSQATIFTATNLYTYNSDENKFYAVEAGTAYSTGTYYSSVAGNPASGIESQMALFTAYTGQTDSSYVVREGVELYDSGTGDKLTAGDAVGAAGNDVSKFYVSIGSVALGSTDVTPADYTTSSNVQFVDADGNEIAQNGLYRYLDDEGNLLPGAELYIKNGEGLLDRDLATADDVAAMVATSEHEVGTLQLKLHVGADSTKNNQITLDLDAISSKVLGIKNVRVDGKDDTNALNAIETVKEAIQKVSTQRSALGAVQNRLEHTINNLDNVVENTTAAESQIRDTDMAAEMVKYSNNNILAQAGQAMLAQANQANQGVLSILG